MRILFSAWFLVGLGVQLSAQISSYSINEHDSIFVCNREYISLFADEQFEHVNANVSTITNSLVSTDHCSEGFLVTLQNGSIIHFFRLDPGNEGGHVGNDAGIFKRISSDNGTSWSPPEQIYNDTLYDDRNIYGGLIGQDSIILFFRKYNANNAMAISYHTMLSTTGGQTWEAPVSLNKTPNTFYMSHQIVKVPGRGYMAAFWGYYYIELRFSPDGLDWSNIGYTFDYRNTQQYYLTEVSFAYCGDGRLIGLVRDKRNMYGSTMLHVASNDYGYTWSEPASTNIGYPFPSGNPLIFYDNQHDEVFVVATDRRHYIGNPYYADQSKIWIYRNKPEAILSNPLGFHLTDTINRPFYNYHMFYGYPTFTRKSDGDYLIVFTDCFKKANKKEDADLFQFNISFETVCANASVFAWNTGDDAKSILVNESGYYKVEQADTLGGFSMDSVYVSMTNFEIETDVSAIMQGETLNASITPHLSNTNTNIEWSNGDYGAFTQYTPASSCWLAATVSNEHIACADSVRILVGIDRHTRDINFKNAQALIEGQEISVSPNPVGIDAQVTIPTEGPATIEVFLYNAAGDFLRSYQAINGHFVLNRNGLAAGNYYLLVHASGQIKTKQIVLI